MASYPRPTAVSSNLTPLQQHLYAAGHFGVSFMGYVIAQWVMKFYFPNSPHTANLVPPLLAPWMMFAGRITDGINDPIVGYLSDGLRSRWGRRKPFMVAGLPLVCCLFLLIWYPPAGQESIANFWFATVVLVLFFLAFTVYTGPYLALLPEITHRADIRLRLSALQGIYNVAGLIAAGFITGPVRKMGVSYQAMAWLVTGIALVAFLLPLLGARDDPGRVARQKQPPFLPSLVTVLGNRPFLLYVGSKVLFLTGLLLLVAALPYMAETLLGQDEGEAGILTGIALLSGVASVPVVLRISRRWGRKTAYLFSMRWFAGFAALLALMGPLGNYSWGVWAMRGLIVLGSIGVAGLFALPYAFLSDVTDYERQRTGIDRQGMFFCVQGLIGKFAYAVAPMTVTGLLALFPHHSALVLLAVGPLTALAALAAYVLFSAFPDEEVRQAAERCSADSSRQH